MMNGRWIAATAELKSRLEEILYGLRHPPEVPDLIESKEEGLSSRTEEEKRFLLWCTIVSRKLGDARKEFDKQTSHIMDIGKCRTSPRLMNR